MIYHLPIIHWLSHLHAFADTVQLGSITLRGFFMPTLIFLFLFSCLLTVSQLPPPQPPLSRSFCLFLSSSVLYSYLSSWVLPLRRQADRFWMSHPVRLIPSTPSVSSTPSLSWWWCSSIAFLRLKGQRREWQLSTWTLPLFPFLSASFHLPHLRQSDIYRGTVHLLASSCSFWRKNIEGSSGKGGKVENWVGECQKQQRRMRRASRGVRGLWIKGK